MSTLKKNITASRIALLSRTQETIFHIGDLANLWNIEDKNTLRVTLKRYVDIKLLYRIQRGFYSLIAIEKLDPLLVGSKAIHRFCYLSTESILFEEGYISHKPSVYTFVSEKNIQYSFTGGKFMSNFHVISRQLKSQYLYNDEGTYTFNGIQKARAERAICDMLYFNPKYTFDKRPNWNLVRYIQKKVGYPLSKISPS